MKTLARYAIGVVLAGLLGSPAFAAGDAVKGKKLASEYCTRCHDIELGGKFKQYPPSFAAIAAYRAEDQIRARITFAVLHSAMPEMAFYFLGASDIDDLIAYIVSLEK
jgi:mono/diheme cytochrome c family protein